MTVPSGGHRVVTLPPLHGVLDRLWGLVVDLCEQLPTGWVLVGGQMVMLHGLAAGRTPIRASQDVDVLADLLTDRSHLAQCADVVRRLGLEPNMDSSGKVYRFRRPADGVVVDLLAPDHSPPRWSLRTIGGDTIRIDGGTQALSRVVPLVVRHRGREAAVPVPDLLGALVLKAAAWCADSRDRDRHSADAAFLVSLVDDPVTERERYAGSDRKRLRRLDEVLEDRRGSAWRALGVAADDAYTTWRLLID